MKMMLIFSPLLADVPKYVCLHLREEKEVMGLVAKLDVKPSTCASCTEGNPAFPPSGTETGEAFLQEHTYYRASKEEQTWVRMITGVLKEFNCS